MTSVTDHERGWVRELAREVAALAAAPENEAIKQRWRDVNALRKPDRAPVWCRPVGAWPELLPDDALRCQDHWLRGIERGFQRILIKHDIGDDTPIEPDFAVGASFDVDPPNIWGVDIKRHASGVAGGAWAYDPPLKSPDDFAKLRLPCYTYNDDKTQRALSQAHELLGDILPVRLVCNPPIGATLCNPATYLRGLTEIMMDMATQPELVHRLMAHVRDSVLGAMRQVEATGLLTPNNTGPMTCSNPIGEPGPAGKITLKNLWLMANSQEFDQVSPTMWDEFLLAYQKPIYALFGHTGYGCCESLTTKIDRVLSIPNLRIFVCSAWTDLSKVIDRVGTDYVIMWRQKASAVVFPNDDATIQHDLDEGARQLQGCRYQVVLRELQTLAGHMNRLHVWTRLGKEAAAKYA